MENRKVTIESMVSYPIAMTVPDLRINKSFTREGQTAKFDYDIIEEAIQLDGIKYLFDSGCLKIREKRDRLDLGLESEEESDDMPEIVAMKDIEIIKMLKNQSVQEIEEVLKAGSIDFRERCVRLATQHHITDYAIMQLLQKYCPSGANVMDLMKIQADKERPLPEEENN